MAVLGTVILPVRARSQPRVNRQRFLQNVAGLAEFGKTSQGGTSRLAYSDADLQGRDYVMGLMRAAGLEPRIDAAGNILGRRAGRAPNLPPLVMGSHIDTVPEGGNYDGVVGSLGAIEVAHTLADGGITTRHALEVIIFQNEEGGLVGSRALVGDLAASELEAVSRSGKTIREGIRLLGGDPDRLAAAQRRPGDVAAYLELHIEQGGILEAEGSDIGVVEGIVGIKWWEVTFEGFANHAGTTPMDRRQDALLAAAKFVQGANRIVTSVPGRQVGTVGRIQAFPGAPNVIPGKVICSLELRDLDAAKINSLYERIAAEAREIADAGGTKVGFQEIHVNIPALTDERVRGLIAQSAKELDLSAKTMPSGAGHDAQAVARVAPVGMIFIPSVGGISHSPQEFSRPQDLEKGANVLLRTLLKLDRAPWI